MGFGVFYIIKCWNSQECFYKVGITSYSVKRRYNSKRDMPYNYEIIQRKNLISPNKENRGKIISEVLIFNKQS